MSSVGCPDLSRYLVDLATLECTEFHYKVLVHFTVIVKEKPSNKVNDNPATPDIIKLITAVANSSGGVVSLSCQGVCDDRVIKDWMHEFKSKLKSFFPQDEFVNNNLIDYERTTGKITLVHILIKKSVHPIIFDYGLYQRSDEENIKVVNNETAARLMKAKSGTFVEQTCSSFEWQTPSGVYENRNTELKCWKTKNGSEILKRLRDERNESSLFAFLNNPEGGTIFIGITDNSNIIEGQILSEHEEATLIRGIEKILSEDRQGQKRIWGSTEKAPARGTYWDVKMDEVVNGPDNQRRVVIKILLKHYPGGVFKHIPQTFKTDDDGTVILFTINNWRTFIGQFFQPHQTIPEATFQAYTQKAKAAADSMRTDLDKRSKQTNSVSSTASTNIDQIDSTSLHFTLKQEQRLSFTDNNNDWREYLYVGHHKLSDFSKYASNPQGVEQSSLTFLPDKKTIVAYGNETKKIQQCISEIEKIHGSTQGVAITSKEWMKLICDNSSSLPSAPPGHVMDIVSFDRSGNINVWVVFHRHPANVSAYEYVRNVGRMLKLNLMAELSTKHVPSVSVQSRLFIDGQLCPSSYLDQVCRQFFTPDQEQSDIIQQAIYALLLRKQTSIHTTVGDLCLVQLSMHQASQVIGSDLAQFTQVHGGPGTGKTLLLLYMSNHVFKKEECLILCANKNLKAYFDFLNAAEIKVITSDDEMISFLESNLFQSYFCLLIDDCQLLSLKKETWFAVFEKVRVHHKVLVVFSDNEIQNYGDLDTDAKCTEAVDEYQEHQSAQQNAIIFKKIKLEEVHRNSQKVTSFISKSTFTLTKCPLRCAHDEVGDDVEVLRVKKLREQGPDNGLVKLIAFLTDPVKLQSGQIDAYDEKHIVVLIDGNNTESDLALFNKVLNENGFQTQGADRFPVTGIIVTSVKSFTGLDAKVVLLVAPERFSSKYLPDIELGMHNDRYKAAVASRGIYRVIFLMEEDLHSMIMKAMNMDKLASVVMYKPDYTRASIKHTSPLPATTKVYSSLAICQDTGHVLITAGDTLHVYKASSVHVHTVTVTGSDLQYVAVSKNGLIYVTDLYDRIHIINQSAWSYTSLGSPGSGLNEFNDPLGVSINTSGEVFVVDSNNLRVQVLGPGGKYRRELGSRGSKHFMFYPLYVSVSPTGTVAVSDTGGNITLFTEAGKFLRTVVIRAHGSFVNALALLYDSRDNLLVADHRLGLVVLGPKMNVVTVMKHVSFGKSVIYILDVAVSPDGSLLVSVRTEAMESTNMSNKHIYLLDIPRVSDSV